MPENAVVTNEMVEKLIALPTIYEIIGAPYPYVVTIIPLTHKAVILILPSQKRKFLSEADNTVAVYRGDQANVPRGTHDRERIPQAPPCRRGQGA
jgi:hypothetical protein